VESIKKEGRKMRKVLLLISCFTIFAMSQIAYAQQCDLFMVIPDRFVTAICKDTDPNLPFEEKNILESAKQIQENNKVEQVCMAFYAPNKKTGDGILAYAAYGGKNPEGLFLQAPNEEVGKLLEKIMGYEISPKDLWTIYDDNEVVADEDFKGKPVLLKVKNSGLSKDAMGKPYIKISTDEFGFEGIQIYLSKTDPSLRKLKKGQTLTIRAIPRGFMMNSVIVDGEVLLFE
jgi:hypothetical protein